MESEEERRKRVRWEEDAHQVSDADIDWLFWGLLALAACVVVGSLLT